MIEVTIRLRYEPELPSEGYPDCLTEVDALSVDKRAYEIGLIDLRDILTWADATDEEYSLVVNNAPNLDVEFAVVQAPDPGTHL